MFRKGVCSAHGMRDGHSHPVRTLYTFDPRRMATLLIGGDKTGDDRWYEVHVPIAEKLYDQHLMQLKREGEI